MSQESKDMETPDELLEKTSAKVKEVLAKYFPDFLEFGDGSFTITFDDVQIMVIVRPFTENETCVECLSHLVSGADINADLTKFLLRKNAEIHFGAFALLFDGTITFTHSITGTNLDDNELLTTINSVSTIAGYYGREIIELAGGTNQLDTE